MSRRKEGLEEAGKEGVEIEAAREWGIVQKEAEGIRLAVL